MAYDEGLASLMRDDLADLVDIDEKRMFGGICFMWRGNMLCGVHKDGAMYRVGKDSFDTALAIDGAAPMAFTGRPMSGFVDVTDSAMADDATRTSLLELAKGFVAILPPK
jgi:hypothetical protein